MLISEQTIFQAMITEQTCGDACWHAREDICRCSCGGRNHGCLRTEDGIQPNRTAKIDGYRYELKAVGTDGFYDEAKALNEANGPYRTDRINATSFNDNGDPVVSEIVYAYHYHDTDKGAPARVRPASRDQIVRWPELAAWRSDDPMEFYRRSVYLLWVKIA